MEPRLTFLLGEIGEGLKRARPPVLKASRRSWMPWAAAAAVLLAAGLWAWRLPDRGSPAVTVPPSSAPVSPREARLPGAGMVAASALEEWVLGPTATAALAPGSRGGLDARGRFRLEEGLARVETSGEAVHISIGEEILEVLDGALALQAGSRKLSWLLREAEAGGGDWGVTVLRGTAKAGDRILKAGESLGSGASLEDFRGWNPLTASEGLFRNGARTLLPAEAPSAYVAEFRVRKRQSSAEGALLFRAGGKPREVVLGGQLPSSGWVRLRLEISAARVRLLVGGRTSFACTPGGLDVLTYPSEHPAALSLKAWGGDLEIGEARWRP